MSWCSGGIHGRHDAGLMPAVSDCCRVHLLPCNISKVHGLKLINLIDLGRGDAHVIAIDRAFNESCTIMALEAADDALVHWLDMSCEIWFKIHNANVLKTIRNDVS